MTIEKQFERIDEIAFINQKKVLDAFREHRVSEAHFAPTSGYGYDDLGRDTLDKIYADVFGCESALVRHNFVSGTHALTVMLFSVLRPGDTLLAATGKPYDTLENVIGIGKKSGTTLADFGIKYAQADLKDGLPDYDEITKKLSDPTVKAVLIQRSKGYDWRPSLDMDKMERLISFIKNKKPGVIVLVDNCYGEFVEEREPVSIGADLMAGSLIKNPGGGLAQTGGYIAGKEEYVRLAADFLTAPGIGLECGANLGTVKSMYQGFFMAPHTVACAVKTAVYCAAEMQKLGYEVSPLPDEKRTDIIQAVKLGNAEKVIKFCQGIQAASPVDAHVTPTPWDMPGYTSQVIMAAGTFVSGASIEISADAPIREPYVVYLQGGLTYEAGKIAVMSAVNEINKI